MSRARRPSPALAASLLGLLASACAMDLPISERIVSVRPLGMRVEVLDPFASPDAAVRAEAEPVESIRVVPLFVDPEGPLTPERIEAEIEPIWLACPLQPIQGVLACLQGQLPLTLDEIEECPAVDFASIDFESGELPAMPAPCRITGGTPAEPTMQVPLDFNFFIGGDLELTMIGHHPGVGDTEQCAADLLAERSLSFDCIYAVQRASVYLGPQFSAAIGGLGESFGLGDFAGTLPDPLPDADRNTRIQSLRVVVTDEEGLRGPDLPAILEAGEVIEVARGDTLTVEAGQTLVIETNAAATDLQLYPIPWDGDASDAEQVSAKDEDCRAWLRKLEDDGETIPDGYAVESFGDDYSCRVEAYEGDWFRTWGTLLSNDSDDPRSLNTWRMVPGEQDDMESDLPPEGVATLYYVLRDDRQGVDWWWFHVVVE